MSQIVFFTFLLSSTTKIILKQNKLFSNVNVSKFVDSNMETIVGNINITNSKEHNDINSYEIMTFETIVSRNEDGEQIFGILINFERNTDGKNGILISYNLMCAILVMISLVNFLINPNDSNRAAVLVALILVLATIFNSAQVSNSIIQHFICTRLYWYCVLYA